MPELAQATGYRIPLLQQNFEPAKVSPLVPDQRALAKGALWGSIANAIASLPKTLIDSYKEGKQLRKDTQTEKDRQAAEQAKRDRETMLSQKLQEAAIPSAVAVESPANTALGITPGTVGGVSAGKPLLSDFTVAPSGITYNPEDPNIAKAKADYYSGKLTGLGKENQGLTFPSAQDALNSGYDPEGGTIHPDGTITVSKYKPIGIDTKGRGKITDAQTNQLKGAANLAIDMKGAEELHKRLWDEGKAGPAAGRWSNLWAKAGYGDAEYVEANGRLKIANFRVARLLNGPGVLTDKDIARAQELAPTLNETPDSFAAKMKAVRASLLTDIQNWKAINASKATAEQVALADGAIESLRGVDATTPAAPASVVGATVRMKTPDKPGKPGRIIIVPAERVEDAKALGATLAE